MATLTVRIKRRTHDKLRRIAEQARQPMVEVLEKAVEEYRRAQFLAKANEEFARLRKSQHAWKEELRERKAWDAAMRDGLREDE